MVVATAVGTATVGGFTGAGLLAGGCGILWELSPQKQIWAINSSFLLLDLSWSLSILFSFFWRRSPGSRWLNPYHTHRREAFGWLSSWISPPALTVLFILWWRSPGSRQLDPYHTHRREAFGWLSSRISPPALTVLPKSDGSSSAARSRCGTSPSWWWTWSRRAVRSSFGSLSTRTAMDGEWTFVQSTGARAVAMRSGATMWGWIWRWKFNWWERMAGSWWRSWKWLWSVRWWEGDWWCALGSFLVEVAGEQVAQPLPYPPTGGIRLTVQLDQSPGSHRLVHPLVEVAGEQTARPLPYPPTGGIRLTVQQDQSPGSHRLAEEWWK